MTFNDSQHANPATSDADLYTDYYPDLIPPGCAPSYGVRLLVSVADDGARVFSYALDGLDWLNDAERRELADALLRVRSELLTEADAHAA